MGTSEADAKVLYEKAEAKEEAAYKIYQKSVEDAEKAQEVYFNTFTKDGPIA